VPANRRERLVSSAKRHIITVDKVVVGGQGLARLADGMVVMVPFVLPGETVEVALGRQHKGYASATLLEVIDPSPARIEPLCPHFGGCGGCDLQHADYQGQLAIKSAILDELAARAGIGADGALLAPVLPSPDAFHYRQRIRLQIDTDGRLGFFARRSHAVIEVEACPLAVRPLNQALAEARRLPGFHHLVTQASAMELLLNPASSRVVVMLQLRRKPRPADQQAALALAAGSEVIQSVWLTGDGFAASGPYCGDAACEHRDCGRIAFAAPDCRGGSLTMGFEAGGFCQVNLAQNERLLEQVHALAQVGVEDSVLDLFCGMGNFSLPLATESRRVFGSDLQRSSIRAAQANAAANQLANCLFLRADAQTAARQLIAADEWFEVVLLDPPRQGCREVLPLLPKLGSAKVLYISCDPATLVRDISDLQGLGYSLRHLRGVDMFPQTCHLEAIALLVRE